MNILVLSHTSELVGGAERSIIEVLSIWEKEYGVKPEFILRKPVGTLGAELDRRGWKYHAVPYGFWSESTPPTTTEQRYKKALQNSQAALAIEDIIKQAKPDAVLTNSIVCPWAAFAAQYQQVPHIWFVREYGDLDHGRVFDMDREMIFQDVDTLSRLVLTNSRALNQHISQYIPSKKVTTLYHPFNIDQMIDDSRQNVASPYTSKDSLKLVLPAGSVTRSKGFLEAITAVGELNKQGHDVELCIIGNTYEKPFMEELHQVIASYAVEHKVHFVGYQKNPLPLIASADIGIMASRMEAFGRVTFEYMALSKPVVGVGAGGTLEMVKNGQNGYTWNYQDAQSLVAALQHYVDSPELIVKHGNNSLVQAKRMVSGEHDVHAAYKQVQQALSEETTQQPSRALHYSHTWLEYPALADTYIKEQGTVSVKKLLAKNGKARIKHTLHGAKAAYRRKFK